MPLETGSYISDLVTTNPTGSDTRRQGDDHIRLIKTTVKNTFPNINAAVTATDEELNFVDGVTSSIQTQLNTVQSQLSAKEPTISSSNRVNAAEVGTGIISNTEFNYLNGVTSSIQTQLNAKASSASVLLTKGYTSTGQTITSGGLLTLAHGLGAEPKIIQLVLQCVSSEDGWVPGDRIWANYHNGASSTLRYNSVYCDATYIRLRYSGDSSCFVVGNKTTGAFVSLVNTNWRLYIKAYA